MIKQNNGDKMKSSILFWEELAIDRFPKSERGCFNGFSMISSPTFPQKQLHVKTTKQYCWMRKTIGEWRKQEGMVTESVKWRLKRFAFDPNEHMLEWRSSWRALGHVCFWVGPNWLETKIFNFSIHLTQELLQYIYTPLSCRLKYVHFLKNHGVY
jgi:hypothetical protein